MADISIDKTLGGKGGPDKWTLSEGDTLGGYRVIRPLGRGGMGEVYLVEHERMGKRYALKLILPEHAGEEGFQQRFALEARVMADLEHPNIVRVHYMGEEDGRFYLAMDSVEGPDGKPHSLHDLLAEKGKLPEDEARKVALEIARALDYAHTFQAGIVHRDLKPGNVLLDAEGRVKVSDFGLALAMGEGYAKNVVEKGARLSVSSARTVAAGAGRAGLTQSDGAIVGTFEYMAPEQEEGRADARSDIYSLGLILYKMLTGRRARGAFDMPAELGCAAAWDPVVRKCLRQRPEDRYASAAELATDIERGGRGRRRARQTGPRGRRAGRRGRRGLKLAAAALALLIVGGVVLGLAGSSGSKRRERVRGVQERRPTREAEAIAEAARSREAEAQRKAQGARHKAEEEMKRKAEEERLRADLAAEQDSFQKLSERVGNLMARGDHRTAISQAEAFRHTVRSQEVRSRLDGLIRWTRDEEQAAQSKAAEERRRAEEAARQAAETARRAQAETPRAPVIPRPAPGGYVEVRAYRTITAPGFAWGEGEDAHDERVRRSYSVDDFERFVAIDGTWHDAGVNWALFEYHGKWVTVYRKYHKAGKHTFRWAYVLREYKFDVKPGRDTVLEVRADDGMFRCGYRVYIDGTKLSDDRGSSTLYRSDELHK